MGKRTNRNMRSCTVSVFQNFSNQDSSIANLQFFTLYSILIKYCSMEQCFIFLFSNFSSFSGRLWCRFAFQLTRPMEIFVTFSPSLHKFVFYLCKDADDVKMFLLVPGVISYQTDADCGEDVYIGNRMLRLLPKVKRQRMSRPWSEAVCYCSVDFVVLRLVQVKRQRMSRPLFWLLFLWNEAKHFGMVQNRKMNKQNENNNYHLSKKKAKDIYKMTFLAKEINIYVTWITS